MAEGAECEWAGKRSCERICQSRWKSLDARAAFLVRVVVLCRNWGTVWSKSMSVPRRSRV